MAERRRDSPLEAGLDVERAQRQPLAALGERAGRRRQSFPLVERAAQRGSPRLRDACLLLELLPHALDDRLAETRDEVARRLAAQLESLSSAPQPVERCGRSLAASGDRGEILLDPLALLQERLQRLLELPPLLDDRPSAPLRVPRPLSELGQVDGRYPRAQAGDLPPELLRTLGRGRLQGQGPQALRHLGLEVARALDLLPDARELQLRAMAPALEAAEPCRVLDEGTALGGARGQDRLDLALADDRARARAEPDVGEQLDHVQPAHLGAVDEVLALAAAVQPPHDGDLGEVEPRQRLVGVVEDELDLAELGLLASGGAGEEHVVGLLGPELARRQRARRPDERVRDVRLPRPVRSDDDGDPRLEPHFDLVGERLEPPHANGLQVHAGNANDQRG